MLAVVLLYLFPASEAIQREEDIRVLSAYNTLVQFTDAVRNKGYLSVAMYNDFVREMEASGNTYEIELELHHKKYYPEYADPANGDTFQNKFSVVYDSYYTQDIMKVLFPENPPSEEKDDHKYTMQLGDFFTVTATNRSRTAYAVLSVFLNGVGIGGGDKEVLTYGGMVLNEDY